MDYEVVATKKAEIISKGGSQVCPPREAKLKKILKKANEPITIGELGKFLEMISWGLSHRGCGYHYIHNQYGKLSKFCARSNNVKNEKTGDYDIDSVEITIKNDDVFGKDGCGGIYICLYNCVIELSEGSIYIYNEKNDGIHISFYNFDNPLTEKEKLIETFPKDYVIRLKCDECGHIVNESHHMSAFYIVANWTMIVMGRGLSTAPCEKCKNTTFSDVNISNEIKIYRLKTNRVVNFQTIKKEAEEQNKQMLALKYK